MASSLLNQRLRMYLEAERAILMGQSYTIGNRTLTKANLATVRNTIDDLVAAGATLDDEKPARRAVRVVLY